MSDIKKISEHTCAAHMADGRVFFLSNRMDGSLGTAISTLSQYQDAWEAAPMSVGNERIVAFGPNNSLPTFIRDVVSGNNLVPGIINRQMGLLWGQGPELYQLGYENGAIQPIWQDDKDIKDWMNSWNCEEYLRGCILDYLHLGGFFDAKYLARGHRIGQNKFISKLEHIPAKNARLEWPASRKLSDVKRIFVGDFERNCYDTGIAAYPVTDRKNPGKYPVSASYNHLYSFSRDFYSVPQFWGALKWIIRGSEIPEIFKYVTENSINLAYHVHSPEQYWEMRRDIISKLHPEWDEIKVENEIMKITSEMLRTITDVLAGKENAGKMFHSVDTKDEFGNTCSWKIESVDQKIKDFIEGQLKIAEASTSAITSGMGLHPSLSNIMVNGKLASGSELLYAFKLFLNTDIAIPSSVILESLNQAIAFNFPDKDLKVGFYHQSVKSEEQLSGSQRLKNN